MTKKDFIELADIIKEATSGMCPLFTDEAIEALADFCASQNPRFNRERWLGYIAGTITSTRSELQAYLLELQLKIDEGRMQGLIARDLVSHWEDLAIETLDAINELDRRECPHEDFADTLSGRKCLSCGLETNNQPEPKGYPDDYSAAFRARFPK